MELAVKMINIESMNDKKPSALGTTDNRECLAIDTMFDRKPMAIDSKIDRNPAAINGTLNQNFPRTKIIRNDLNT